MFNSALSKKNNSKFPKLRFKEFLIKIDKYNQSENNFFNSVAYIKEFVKEINNKNKDKNLNFVLSVTKEKGLISQKERFLNKSIASDNKNNYKIVEKNDFVYNPSTIHNCNIAQVKHSGQSLVSPYYISFKTHGKNIVSLFLYYLFKSRKFNREVIKRLEGSVRNALKFFDLCKISIFIPTLNEQNKIADFFTLIYKKTEISEKINNKKKTLLKSFDLKNFEKNKNLKAYYELSGILDDFFTNYSGLQGWTSESRLGTGNKFIPYKKIYNQRYCYFSDSSDFEINNKKQNLINYDDILVTNSSETQNELAMCSVYLSKENVYLDPHCFGLRIKKEWANKINTQYLSLILSFSKYRQKILQLSQGSTRFSCNKREFCKLEIKIPNYEEQVKISNLFYRFYNLIEIEEKLINLHENLKTYLINNMF